MRLLLIGIFVLVNLLLNISCANRALKYENVEGLKKIDEFDQQVQITAPDAPPAVIDVPAKAPEAGGVTPPAVSEIKAPITKELVKDKKSKAKPKKEKLIESKRRMPEIENDIGFSGRRPLNDPFRVGERVVQTVSYLGVKAGKIAFESKPFATVNGKKSYQFQISAWTTSLFASAYSMDDKAVTLVDFDSLVPHVYTVHLKETGQLKEGRAFFDRNKGQATYWEKKVTQKEGEQEKKLQWEIPDFSQNAFSAVFYMRVFQWNVGDERLFRVADDNQNLILRLKAVRREQLDTDVGELKTIVLQPKVEINGAVKPIGDILFWITDDDRKLLVKIEAKIAVGTLVSEVSEINLGYEQK